VAAEPRSRRPGRRARPRHGGRRLPASSTRRSMTTTSRSAEGRAGTGAAAASTLRDCVRDEMALCREAFRWQPEQNVRSAVEDVMAALAAACPRCPPGAPTGDAGGRRAHPPWCRGRRECTRIAGDYRASAAHRRLAWLTRHVCLRTDASRTPRQARTKLLLRCRRPSLRLQRCP
jgi:hypothetical protein